MPITVPTPKASSLNKGFPGGSDTTHAGAEYLFMGCSVTNVSASLGFNNTASSLSITLVEDVKKGQSFQVPQTPSIHAFSLPKGGVGQPIFHTGGINLNPDSYYPANVPFYFCGIVSSYSVGLRNISGRTIPL